MVGLDAAGKTTILYKLKLGEIVTTIPTIGTYTQYLAPISDAISGTKLTMARLQRRDCRVQEHLVHRVGCRWSGQDPSAVAPLYVKIY